MHTSLIIVDDFLGQQDALSLREAALKLTYPDLRGPFPGRNSLERIEIEGLSEIASHLTGERLKPINPLQSHGKFRITLASDIGSAKVHIDQAYWSGILYLSKPEDCRGGTEFFRHRPSNRDRAPLNDAELAEMGFASHAQMHQEIIEKHSNDDSVWEPTMQVPMRFNRLVLLRPWLWHTAGPAFGSTMEDGRLVYLMFFTAA